MIGTDAHLPLGTPIHPRVEANAISHGFGIDLRHLLDTDRSRHREDPVIPASQVPLLPVALAEVVASSVRTGAIASIVSMLCGHK